VSPELANIEDVIRGAMGAWRPPPRLSLSEWADTYFYLSAESAAEPGRWKTLPYQRGMMDAVTDPKVEQISVMKSARVGYTKIMNAAVGFFMHQDPSGMLVVQPTVDDAKGYSKEEIAPMLRDTPVLEKLILDESEEGAGPKDSGNTILHKSYPGGVLSMVGANSGAGFRRISRRVVIFDETDGYPPSAGSDGDQIKLGINRTQFFWNRKIIAGSTPLLAGHSRIESLFEAGDQRRFYVPCPQCGHMDYLVFNEKAERGHFMQWPEGQPEKAFFVCRAAGCIIEHKDKRAMVSAGEWRAHAPFKGHASFHIWAAYSFSPNATWGQIAAEFVAAVAKKDPEVLKTFVNTVLGETWKEMGDAPDWQRVYNQRELYEIGTVPEGVKFLTCGVDVQKDRWVWEVVGWGPGKESWSVDSGVIPGNTANAAEWKKISDLLAETWFDSARRAYSIRKMAVDSGFNTQSVYSFARRNVGRVIAIKGNAKAKTLIGPPTPVEVKEGGKRIARGCKVWPVGVDIAKGELYGFLGLPLPEPGEVEYPAGFCHFPQYAEDFFKQLTAEHLVSTPDKRTGFPRLEWQMLPGRENHHLDARVYARAAAAVLGVDRMKRRPGVPRVAAPTSPPELAATVDPVAPPPQQPAPRRPKVRRQITDSGFWKNRGKDWLR
jgi:phage terminase large subunit GpA-like protein